MTFGVIDFVTKRKSCHLVRKMESGDPADSPSSSPILAVGGVSIPSLQPTTTTTTWTASPHPVVIKWAGKEIELADVSGAKTVLDLKALIHARTGVQVDRQKLLNLSFKGEILLEELCNFT